MTLRLFFATSMLCALPAVAADVTLHWSEIAPTVKGVNATVVLTNGNRLKGVIADVQPDALTIDPNKNVPRDTVAQIRIRKNRIKGRIIGTSVGTFFGAGGAATTDFGSAGERALSAAIWIGGGYLIGYAIDRHEVVINIAP
jgi:uncharacterized protein YcfJ